MIEIWFISRMFEGCGRLSLLQFKLRLFENTRERTNIQAVQLFMENSCFAPAEKLHAVIVSSSMESFFFVVFVLCIFIQVC